MILRPSKDQSPPSDHDIEAVIQMATANSAASNTLHPPRDTRTQLFVGNLPYRVRWQDLKDLFRKAGTVLRADVSLGPDNRSRGYGTVLLATAEDAGRAVDMYNGYEWQTRVLEVRPDRLPLAPPQPQPQPTANSNAMPMPLPQHASPSTLNSFSQPLLRAPLSEYAGAATATAREHDELDFRDMHRESMNLLHARSHSQSHFDPQLQAHFELSNSRPGTSGGISAASAPSASLAAASAAVFPNNPPNRTLFVGNLPFHIQWQDLKDLFRLVGPVMRADVALSADGRSRGFGTVVFRTEEDAERAKSAYDGYEFNGRTLKVHFDKFTQPQAGLLHISGTSPSPYPSTSSSYPVHPSNLSSTFTTSLLPNSQYSSSAYSSTSPHPSTTTSPYSSAFSNAGVSSFSSAGLTPSTVTSVLQQHPPQSSTSSSTAVSPSPTKQTQSLSSGSSAGSPFAFSPLTAHLYTQSQGNSRSGSRPAVASTGVMSNEGTPPSSAGLSLGGARVMVHGRSQSQTQPHLVGPVAREGTAGPGVAGLGGRGDRESLALGQGHGQSQGTPWDVPASSSSSASYAASYPSVRKYVPTREDREREQSEARREGTRSKGEVSSVNREESFVGYFLTQGATGGSVLTLPTSVSASASLGSGLHASGSGSSSGASILDRLPRSASGLGPSTSLGSGLGLGGSRLAYESRYEFDTGCDENRQLESQDGALASRDGGYMRGDHSQQDLGGRSGYEHEEDDGTRRRFESGRVWGGEVAWARDVARARDEEDAKQSARQTQRDRDVPPEFIDTLLQELALSKGSDDKRRTAAGSADQPESVELPRPTISAPRPSAVSANSGSSGSGTSGSASGAGTGSAQGKVSSTPASVWSPASTSASRSASVAATSCTSEPMWSPPHLHSESESGKGDGAEESAPSVAGSEVGAGGGGETVSESGAGVKESSGQRGREMGVPAEDEDRDLGKRRSASVSGPGRADGQVPPHSLSHLGTDTSMTGDSPGESATAEQERQSILQDRGEESQSPPVARARQISGAKRSPRTSRAARGAAQAQQQQQHPHHPGPISLPPPPPASAFPLTQAHGVPISPYGVMPMNMHPGMPMGSPGHYPGQPQMSPMYHPLAGSGTGSAGSGGGAHTTPTAANPTGAHGYVGANGTGGAEGGGAGHAHYGAGMHAHGMVPVTPHGLPPITPSMPPFTFLPQQAMMHPTGDAISPGVLYGAPPMGMRAQHHPGMMGMGMVPASPSQTVFTPSTLGPSSPHHHPHYAPGPGQAAAAAAAAAHFHAHHHHHALQHQQHQHVLSTFSPGIAMSPGAVYAGGNPHINPAVGAPVHMFGQASPHGHPGYFYPTLSSLSPGEAMGAGGAEPAGYFDTVYLPPMPMYGGMSGLGPGAGMGSVQVGGGVANEMVKERNEKETREEGASTGNGHDLKDKVPGEKPKDRSEESALEEDVPAVLSGSAGSSASSLSRTFSMSPPKRPMASAPTLVHRPESDPAPKTPGVREAPPPSSVSLSSPGARRSEDLGAVGVTSA